MDREIALDIFRSFGFKTVDQVKPTYTKLYYNEERVGTVYADSVALSDCFPSLQDDTLQYYADTPKKMLSLDITSENELVKAIEYLLNSTQRYDEEKRQKRVDMMHAYFERKKTEKILNGWKQPMRYLYDDG